MNTMKDEQMYILQTYKRAGLCAKKGSGKYVWDEKGRKYLDFFAGVSVCNIGHCHPKVVSAINTQARQLIHASNHYYTEPQSALAKKLIGLSFPGRVFLSNSGAEANECALKLARKWGNEVRKIKGTAETIVFTNSFHGRTFATLTATGQKKFHKGFEPLLSGFKYAQFNDLASVRKLVNKNTVAVMIEPVQGEGGVNIADKAFLKGLRKLCSDKKLLLIFDEVQSGMGRTGSLFAYQYYGVKPDVMTLAKSLGGGLPIGATVIAKSFEKVLAYGDHGSTFGGNPVACAAAVAVLDAMTPGMLANVGSLGGYLLEKLRKLKDKYAFIRDIRSIGLMTGIELEFPGKDIVEYCLSRGLIINCTQNTVLRFLPPFVITRSDIDTAVKILDEALQKQKR